MSISEIVTVISTGFVALLGVVGCYVRLSERINSKAGYEDLARKADAAALADLKKDMAAQHATLSTKLDQALERGEESRRHIYDRLDNMNSNMQKEMREIVRLVGEKRTR